ncbi:MAG TPA: primosomal protein N' [Selenomonas sp.]|nr:primosomal protein N' [Selenomonas sp.]
MLTADVFVNIPVKSISKAYTYAVPDNLAFLSIGWRVFVPFGGRKLEGFVLSVSERAESTVPLKDIIGTVDDEAWFSPEMIALSMQASEFYLCSPAEIMRLFMPGKSGLKLFTSYAADAAKSDHTILQAKPYMQVYGYLLREGAKSGSEIKRALPERSEDLENIMERLLHYKLIVKEYNARKRASELYERFLVGSSPITEEILADFKRKKAQRHLLELLREKSEISFSELKELKISAATAKAVAETGLAKIQSRRILRDSYRDVASQKKDIALTNEQQAACDSVLPYIEQGEYHAFLLHGVTGSGKTQVYMELTEAVRRQGRNVIVLVPEIALTGQLVMNFKSRFSEDIIVIHSRLSVSERNDAALRVRQNEAGIIIGARSALFVPAKNIGLIVLDEEQDMSYKQDESPRYHARVIAEFMAKLHNAVLVLGSATPSMESYYRAQQGEFTLLSMPHRIGDKPLPHIQAIDMRQEFKRGNRHILSGDLKALIEKTVSQGQQMIIMLNRRGYSTFVMCRTCGTVLKCKQCGLPLVYHRNGKLLCHHCDIRETVPDICPNCGSHYIKFFGSGTEKLEQELKEAVPTAKVLRMDRDTTTGKFAHQEILEKFRSGSYDILMGTQMVAKGHDIPNVMAVGIISADSSLNMPDFRASERCFMLITQTAGRAGRYSGQGSVQDEAAAGEVIVQAYQPQHYAVACGIRQDYESFYKQELSIRKQLSYPPFSRLVKLLFQNEDEKKARENAAELVQLFRRQFPQAKEHQIIGPSPAVISQFCGIYRFVVLIKTREIESVIQFLKTMGMHLRTDVAIDIDPISMM